MAVKKVKVEMLDCTCERCGYNWQTDVMPLRCAKCKTPYWDRAKKPWNQPPKKGAV